jgi:thiol-disulfide isomerase/thioredoxin
MIEIGNVSKFNEIMTSTTELIIIVFTSIWHKPCYNFNIQIENIEQKYKYLKILSVDINDNSIITKEYDVKEVPTTVFYNDGTLTNSYIVGSNKLNEIEDIIKKNI